jgi:hypothetical protein
MRKLFDRSQVNWSYSHGMPVWLVDLQKVLFFVVIAALLIADLWWLTH